MYHFCLYICPINNEQHLSQMNTTTFPPTFEKQRYYNDKDETLGWCYSAATKEYEEAESWASEFPKSCRVWAASSSGNPSAKGVIIFKLMYPATNAGMGIANEAGEARLRSFLRHVKRLGLRIKEEASA